MEGYIYQVSQVTGVQRFVYYLYLHLSYIVLWIFNDTLHTLVIMWLIRAISIHLPEGRNQLSYHSLNYVALTIIVLDYT